MFCEYFLDLTNYAQKNKMLSIQNSSSCADILTMVSN